MTGNQAGSVNPPQTEGFLLAHAEISADKIAAYRATDHRFGEGPDVITLRIDQASPPLQELFARLANANACGVFITACNPHGAAPGAAANEAAHLRLGRELRRLYPNWLTY